jgi:hypothetical protein
LAVRSFSEKIGQGTDCDIIALYGLTVALFWGMGWGLLTHGQTILPESSEKNIKRALSSTVYFLGLRPLGNSLVFFPAVK